MGIQVRWDNDEKTVICYSFEGRWTWDELHDAIAESRRLLDAVDYKVNTIADMRQSTILPPSLLSNARAIMSGSHPNEGFTVVVGSNKLVQIMYDMTKRVYPRLLNENRLIVLPTMEQAYARLDQKRQQRKRSESELT